MRDKLQRVAALLLLVIPGIMATYGILIIKDVSFILFGMVGGDFQTGWLWVKMGIGLLLFAVGSAFIGGWILFRDRKRNYVAPRFREKRIK